MVSLCVLQKERRLLENLRLDLDACKTRLKKAKVAEAKAAVSPFVPPPFIANQRTAPFFLHSNSQDYSIITLVLMLALAMTNSLCIHNLAVRG